MFTFYLENHEPFGALTKNCPKLDKNKSMVSRLSVFVVYESAVKVCSSTLSDLISTSIPRATFSWSIDYFNTIHSE